MLLAYMFSISTDPELTFEVQDMVAEQDHPNVSFIFIIFMEEAGTNKQALRIKGKRM